jgi:hypothetical protein
MIQNTLFLLLTLVFSTSLTVADQPNIVFIMTDQQHAGMMSCAELRPAGKDG